MAEGTDPAFEDGAFHQSGPGCVRAGGEADGGRAKTGMKKQQRPTSECQGSGEKLCRSRHNAGTKAIGRSHKRILEVSGAGDLSRDEEPFNEMASEGVLPNPPDLKSVLTKQNQGVVLV